MEDKRKTISSEKQNRTYKDSLFVDLFTKCPDAKKNFLSLYNGVQDCPAEKTLKLSDAFESAKTQDFPLELCAKLYNISRRNDSAVSQVMRNCAPLSGYANLTEYAREAKSQGRKDFLDYAVQRCIKEGTLSDYLKRNSTGNMLIGEYDYDTEIRVQRMESAEETRIENARNFLELGISQEQVSKGTGLSLEKVTELQEESKLVKV